NDMNGINDLMTDLGRLGLTNSEARGINNLGQVIGAAYGTANIYGWGYRAFLWDNTVGMRDLGTFGGGAAEANDINDAGEVVGTAYAYASFRAAYITAVQGFRWDPVNGGSLLGPFSASYCRKATAVNDAGQIVGNSGYLYAGMWNQLPVYRVNDAFL